MSYANIFKFISRVHILDILEYKIRKSADRSNFFNFILYIISGKKIIDHISLL